MTIKQLNEFSKDYFEKIKKGEEGYTFKNLNKESKKIRQEIATKQIIIMVMAITSIAISLQLSGSNLSLFILVFSVLFVFYIIQDFKNYD